MPKLDYRIRRLAIGYRALGIPLERLAELIDRSAVRLRQHRHDGLRIFFERNRRRVVFHQTQADLKALMSRQAELRQLQLEQFSRGSEIPTWYQWL